MPEGHEHQGMIAHSVTAVPGSIEEALHLGLGEEVLPAAINSGAFAFLDVASRSLFTLRKLAPHFSGEECGGFVAQCDHHLLQKGLCVKSGSFHDR
jgi:hypothetical protein